MYRLVILFAAIGAVSLQKSASTGIVKSPTKSCKTNEVWKSCASPCDTTCKTRIRNQRICTDVCLQQCVCKEGTLRHDNGTCVPTDQCSPPQCNSDEVYSTCGGCETTCDNIGDTCQACTYDCKVGCFCKEGLIRGPDGITCVKQEDCPKPVCGENEVWNKCPDRCLTGKCEDIWTRFNCAKALDCCTPKCVCKKGYYWNSDGVCITGKQCSTQRNIVE